MVSFGLIVVFLFYLLAGCGADSQPPEYKVYQTGEELAKGHSIDNPGLEHVKGSSHPVDREEEELECHKDVAEENGEMEEEVGAGFRDDEFPGFAVEDILVDDMSQIDDILQFLISALMQWKSLDEELLDILAEIVEDRSVAETDGGQLAFEVNFNLPDLKSDLVNNLPVEILFIFQFYVQGVANYYDVNYVLDLLYQFAVILGHGLDQLLPGLYL